MKLFPINILGADANFPLSYEAAFEHFVTSNSETPIIWVPALKGSKEALTAIADCYYTGAHKQALELFLAFKNTWETDATRLLKEGGKKCLSHARDLFTEVEWLLHDAPVRDYHYHYDQIVPVSTLVTSLLFSYYLKENGIENEWIDPRDIIRTDDQFGNAVIDIAFSSQQLNAFLQQKPQVRFVIPAGVGATDENENTQW